MVVTELETIEYSDSVESVDAPLSLRSACGRRTMVAAACIPSTFFPGLWDFFSRPRYGDELAVDGNGRGGGERCVRSLLCCFSSVPFAFPPCACAGMRGVLAPLAGAETWTLSEVVDPKNSCDSRGGDVTIGGLIGSTEESTRGMPWPCGTDGAGDDAAVV